MNDDDAPNEIEETKRETDSELKEMEADAEEMDDRLAEHESEGEEVEVLDPDESEDLSI